MRRHASRSFAAAGTAVLIVLALALPAPAQISKLTNLDLCNGKDRSSPDPQIRGCTALIKSDKNPQVLAVAFNNRGNALAAAGEYELAIRDYSELIKLNPSYAKPLNNRGVAYQKKGDFDLAMKDFEAAINVEPNYPSAIANRGEVFLKQGDYPRALKDFDAALKLRRTLASSGTSAAGCVR